MEVRNNGGGIKEGWMEDAEGRQGLERKGFAVGPFEGASKGKRAVGEGGGILGVHGGKLDHHGLGGEEDEEGK